MIHITLCSIALLISLFTSLLHAEDPGNPDPYANETKEQRDERMQWFREAKFGMFIHWGVYAVPAGTYQGQKVARLGEQIMAHGKIPMADYQAFAKEFNPIKYDPEAWVRLAQAAGMKYIVITAKHHDGFALFDSKVSKWDMVDATPYGRDLIAPLAAACKKYGMKFGVYYSHARDWNQGGSCKGNWAGSAGGKWDPAQEENMDEYIKKIAVPQVKELLSNYGPISMFWWDTPSSMNKERASVLLETLKLQPGIIYNDRLGGGFKGDTSTPEQHIPGAGFSGDWESCMTMNDTWGYKSYDQNWKSTEVLIRNLVDIASKGGNYLLNVGPTAEGVIPEPSVERLKAIGDWMKVNGESIYGTKASPCSRPDFGRITQRESGGNTTVYLHVFKWPGNNQLFVPVNNSVKSCYLLADNKRTFEVAKTEKGITVQLTGTAPDPICSVVVLNLSGPTSVTAANQITQNKDGVILLEAQKATINNALGTKVEVKSEIDAIGGWIRSNVSVEWVFNVDKPGTFTVTAETASNKESAFVVSMGEQSLKTKIPAHGKDTDFAPVEIGTFVVKKAGEQKITFQPDKESWNPVNLRSVTMTPKN
jgi:alpha-L-fucosidase